ncbi:MAG: 2'-5' RNA ligase family protein [Clostridium sp.]|nr:2'-5' RNA ligase family protein [Clostridium sp.]
MERYVIVCVVKGEAGDFNNMMRCELYEKFKAKSSKLPAHFTIKAPFEYDGDISELDRALSKFSANEKKKRFSIKGYNHFDDRVIYMDVKMSKEGKKLHDRLIEVLDKFSYINFKKTDGKDKVFHVTLTSKKLPPKFNEVWDYVNDFPCDFQCEFDNISIYKWVDNKWVLHKEYELSE